MSALPSICDGFWDSVAVSDVQDAALFTLTLEGSQTEFNAMMGEVQRACSTTPTPAGGTSLTVGGTLIAKFSFDNQWYRAQVESINADRSLQVRYVDYGNVEKVNVMDTRDAAPFLAFPQQGVACQLNRIDYSKNIQVEHHNLFRTMCLNKTFKAMFVSKSSQSPLTWCVELYHSTGNVNDWFGNTTGTLTSALVKPQIPSKFPHPHNAGLVPLQADAPPHDCTSERSVPTTFEGTVVYSNTPSEFWLQSEAHADDVMNICALLADYCNSSSVSLLTAPRVGQYCAALYSEDSTWYRGRVVELTNAGVQIYFIDYGNTELVALSGLAVIPPEMISEAGYAIKASLNGVRPSSGASWVQQACDAFSDMVMVSSCQVEVVTTPTPNTHLVNLHFQGASTAANALIEGGFAVATAGSSPAQSTTKQVSQPVAAAVPTAASAAPAPAPVTHQGRYSRPSVESGQRESVFLSWFVHPAEFWVQKEGCEDELAALLDSAKECADQASRVTSPAVGMACVAKYSADNNWYRGEIEACLGKSCAVAFIDYGNSEDISTQDIYPASQSLAATPCLAFKCSLLGINPVGAEWTSECHEFMESLLAEGGTCTFLAKHGDSFLVEMAYNGEQSLQDALVKAKMADWAKKSSHRSDRSQGSQRSSSSSGQSRLASKASSKFAENPAVGDAPLKAKNVVHLVEAAMTNLGLNCGDSMDGCIVHIEHSDKVYVQLTAFKKDIDDLYDLMGLFYHAGKGEAVVEAVIGGYYVVQFTQDNEWYRAKVINFVSGKVEVLYVDYGNTEQTSVGSMRQLAPQFTKLACQGFCCSLANQPKPATAEELESFKTAYTFLDIKGTIELSGDADMLNGAKPVSVLLEGGSTSSSVISTPQRPQPCLKFPAQPLAVGEVKGYLTVEVSQQEFYMQLTADTEQIEEMAVRVQSESTACTQLTAPSVGQACLAKFRDDSAWYRAQITACSSNSFQVLFVDFGNSSSVDSTDVLEISAELCNIKPLAVRCRLITEDPSQNLTEWAADELTVDVKEILEETACVALYNEAGESFTKPVVAESTADNINAELAALGELSNADSIQSAAPIVSTQICLKFPPIQFPAVGEVKGYLTVAANQQEFYVQLTADTELVEEVLTTVRSESTTSTQLTAPSVGQACLAKFRDDGAWYRAQITACSSNSFQVLFVDFGNSSSVDSTDILEISAELCNIKPLAVRCCLATEDPSQNLTEWAADELTVDVKEILEETACVALYNDAGESFTKPVVAESTADNINAELAALRELSNADNIQSAAPIVSTQICLKFHPMQFPAVGEVKGYLTVAANQQEFYVQLTADTELVEEVLTRVRSESTTNTQLTAPSVGQACLAQFRDDGAWYRAQITACSSNSFQVLFVDFGNSSSVDSTDVLEISAELCNIKPLAVRCRLITEDPSQNLTEWAIDELTLHIQEVRDDATSVSLFDVSGAPFIKSEAQSTPQKEAQSTPQKEAQLTPQKEAQSTPQKEAQLTPQKEAQSTPKKEAQLSPQKEPQSSPITTSSAINGISSSLSSTSLTSSPLRVSAQGSPVRNLLVALPARNVEPGEYKAYVSHIGDYDSGQGGLYIQLTFVAEFLAYIEAKLAELGPSAEPEVYCPLGQVCIATYSCDGRYYRGIVIGSNETQHYSTVLFLDYGTSEGVKNSELKVMPKCLRELPPSAFECTIRQEALRAMSKENFFNAVDSVEHTVRVSGDEEPYDIVFTQLGQQEAFSGTFPTVGEYVDMATFKYSYQVPTHAAEDIKMKVEHIVSPSDFYSLFEPGMVALEAAMHNEYSGRTFRPHIPVDQLRIGVACVVQERPGFYARGLVAAEAEGGHYQVLLVDSGRTKSVSSEEMYKLFISCADLPRLAHRCTLRGAHPLSGSVWDDDATSRFYELVQYESVLAQVLQVNEQEGVELPQLVLSIAHYDETVADMLVNTGFCSRIPNSGKSATEFCSELCEEIKDKLVSSPHNKVGSYFSDKVTDIVNELSTALTSQLDQMTGHDDGTCTAQDIVYHVAHQILNKILDATPLTPLQLTVSNKDLMKMEIQNILGDLLEEVLRMNSAMLESLIDDGLHTADNLGKVGTIAEQEGLLIPPTASPRREQGGLLPTPTGSPLTEQGGLLPTPTSSPLREQWGLLPTPTSSPLREQGGLLPTPTTVSPHREQGGLLPTPTSSPLREQGGLLPTPTTVSPHREQGGLLPTPTTSSPHKEQEGLLPTPTTVSSHREGLLRTPTASPLKEQGDLLRTPTASPLTEQDEVLPTSTTASPLTGINESLGATIYRNQGSPCEEMAGTSSNTESAPSNRGAMEEILVYPIVDRAVDSPDWVQVSSVGSSSEVTASDELLITPIADSPVPSSSAAAAHADCPTPERSPVKDLEGSPGHRLEEAATGVTDETLTDTSSLDEANTTITDSVSAAIAVSLETAAEVTSKAANVRSEAAEVRSEAAEVSSELGVADADGLNFVSEAAKNFKVNTEADAAAGSSKVETMADPVDNCSKVEIDADNAVESSDIETEADPVADSSKVEAEADGVAESSMIKLQADTVAGSLKVCSKAKTESQLQAPDPPSSPDVKPSVADGGEDFIEVSTRNDEENREAMEADADQ